jgi:hypothetical protein
MLCAVVMLATALVAQTSTAPKSTRKKAAAAPVTAADVQSLKDAIAAQQAALTQQQQQIQELRDQLRQKDQAVQQAQSAATDATGKADAAQAAATQQQQSVTELKSDVNDLQAGLATGAVNLQESQKTTNRLNQEIKLLGKLKLSGDLRLRYEPFWGGGATTAAEPAQRNRQRYRLRFNVNTNINDDFAAGLSLASGDIGDPISTNQTETGFFTRTPINIDKAFVVYKPHQLKPFNLTAGKFGYTWLRTELTFDNDLNPEGGSAAVNWDWKSGFINHFGIIAIGTPIWEVGGGPDTYMVGGQVQTGWSLGPRVKFIADAAYYNYENADSIAQVQVGGNGFATNGTATTAGGTFGFAGSTNTNNFGDINGQRFYASKFGMFDAIARLDFDTGNKRWPIYALIDFVQNTEACSNLSAFVAAAVALPKCDPHQRHGYWGELKFGQTKNKGDLLLGYTFARIERDAVLAAFNFSDLRQPTNVIEHRVEALYQAYPHVQIGMTGLIGRQIVTAQSTTPERWLKRFQFDTIVTF